jgi:penicillin-binding protein 2
VLRSIKRRHRRRADLYLTIDARLQKVAEDAFVGRAGAAVAIDPRNGEVWRWSACRTTTRTCSSTASARSTTTRCSTPRTATAQPRAAGTYMPGSTVKPYVALAGLELGVRKPEDTIVSTGEFFIPGDSKRAYRDDVRWGHGRVDLREAIAQSVNTYFYGLALEMGIDRFSSSLAKFGFGAPTGIDLIGEASGVLPSREWKRGRYNQAWYPGETVIAGIGQGAWVITPLQLGQAVSVIAARGVRHPPRLLHAVQDGINADPIAAPVLAATPSFIRNPANWTAVEEGMIRVVNSPSGTAHDLGKGFPYVIAGKTGTAERFSRTDEEWTSIGSSPIQRHQVLFECFAPAEDARIAVAVALEAGRSGAHDAAPIARLILDAWARFDDVQREVTSR